MKKGVVLCKFARWVVLPTKKYNQTCFGVLEILMYSGYTHVDYGNGIIWELMFGPEGFLGGRGWGLIFDLF